jgi:hypothetical protein
VCDLPPADAGQHPDGAHEDVDQQPEDESVKPPGRGSQLSRSFGYYFRVHSDDFRNCGGARAGRQLKKIATAWRI